MEIIMHMHFKSVKIEGMVFFLHINVICHIY